MNYNWISIFNSGQKDIGYYDVKKTEDSNIPVLAQINCLPLLDIYNNNIIIHVNVFYEGKEENMTDGFFHWINDDISEICKKLISKYYKKDLECNFFFGEFTCVKKLPEEIVFSFGDYGFPN